MSKHKVVVVSLGYESYETERTILRAVDAELALAPRDCLTEDEVIAAAGEADAILVREAPVGARVIDALPRCRAIVRYGVGVDNIDLEHARRRGVCVANVPGYGTEEAVELDTLLTESDYISLHAPLTPQTRHLINTATLAKMKANAVIVNTARGELIDEKALATALSGGRIAAAGLDVFEQEPPEPDHPLLRPPNVVLSGHVGWYSKDAVRELQTRAAQEIVRVLSGGRPECWVNRW